MVYDPSIGRFLSEYAHVTSRPSPPLPATRIVPDGIARRRISATVTVTIATAHCPLP